MRQSRRPVTSSASWGPSAFCVTRTAAFSRPCRHLQPGARTQLGGGPRGQAARPPRLRLRPALAARRHRSLREGRLAPRKPSGRPGAERGHGAGRAPADRERGTRDRLAGHAHRLAALEGDGCPRERWGGAHARGQPRSDRRPDPGGPVEVAGDSIAVLEGGRIVQEGTLAGLHQRPASAFVQGVLEDLAWAGGSQCLTAPFSARWRSPSPGWLLPTIYY